MNYISTRNNKKNFTFKDVFLKGLADDGGLFVPKSIKQYQREELDKMRSDIDEIKFLLKQIINIPRS